FLGGGGGGEEEENRFRVQLESVSPVLVQPDRFWLHGPGDCPQRLQPDPPPLLILLCLHVSILKELLLSLSRSVRPGRTRAGVPRGAAGDLQELTVLIYMAQIYNGSVVPGQRRERAC
ncbi:hypothetical protein INR49_008064, partial [Caranx melampygus]